jgi:hypothetical protein
VTVYATNSVGDLQVIWDAFKKKFPKIKLNSVGISTTAEIVTKVMAERRASQFLVDAVLGAPGATYNSLHRGKALDPLAPALILPEVTDLSKWWKSKHRYIDPEGQYVFVYQSSLYGPPVYHHTKLVSLDSIRSVWDLLDPKWKGKIIGLWPRANYVSTALLFMYHHPQIGPKFLERFYGGEMDITYFSDFRQGTDWLAAGKYPVESVQMMDRIVREAKGRASVSSARVALGRLERQGLVQLPAGAGRRRSGVPRGLTDDGLALPPVPKLPMCGGKIAGLRLRLIADAHDPAHPIWNRLVVREHPLGRRPLVGSQLRYLIECDAGVIGAFGFGPPAFHLECRDQWVGWSRPAREKNLGQVIGLSRFLIRPSLQVRNLASQCYGLVLRQVARDWFERYGVKPVLVETYVDRVRHHGRSLAAANWRRLGQSKCRGRDDRHRQGGLSPKDVWVYELHPRARAQLQCLPVERLAPRSVFAPTLKDDWAQEEMAGVSLGDERLNARAVRMLGGRWARPTQSFHRSFGALKEAKGAYQLLENPRPEISLSSLLAPHHQQTARRMAAEAVVVLAQDTTALSYNTLHHTTGLGPIGEDHSRGLFVHSLQAFRLDAIPLGTAWVETWARSPESDTAHRNELSVDEKESGRWIRAFQAAGQRARQMPQTQVVVCGDRESDIYELFDQMPAAPRNLHLLVRAQHNRSLVDGAHLRESLGPESAGGQMEVKVPRRQGRPARIATLELRWKEVELRPPAVARKKSWPALKLYVLRAREVAPPEGQEAIDWLLLTTWPVISLKVARRIVHWYALRWGIECWHRVLKGVCRVESRQLKSVQALERALAFDMIVASRALLLSRLGKDHPDLPAELFYTPDELEVLEVKKKLQAST